MEFPAPVSGLLNGDTGYMVLAGIALIGVMGLFFLFRRSARNNKLASEQDVATLVGGGGSEPAPTPPVGEVAVPVAERRPRDQAAIARDIAKAENKGNDERLAELHLEHGCCLLTAADANAAADALRKSVVLASRLDLKAVHAAARLELAQISEVNGDLTTACEHWQIARMLYHDLGQQDDVDQTDAKMLSNGCPTDWVLTDF